MDQHTYADNDPINKIDPAGRRCGSDRATRVREQGSRGDQKRRSPTIVAMLASDPTTSVSSIDAKFEHRALADAEYGSRSRKRLAPDHRRS
jgi:hypothetical protein